MENWPVRSRPSTNHLLAIPGRANVLFVTVCTWEKRPYLRDALHAEVVLEAWHRAAHWRVGRYVILPDHVHFFCSPDGDHDFDLWVKYWKRLTTQNWPETLPTRLWEYNSWDTQVRNARDYDEKLAYLAENPVRRGLCSQPEDWPFQGELHELEWR